MQNGHGDADEMAAAGGFEPDVVVLAVEIFLVVDEIVAVGRPVVSPTFVGSLLTILRVEVDSVGGKRFGASAIVNVEVKGVDFFSAFVGDSDVRVFLKWHREERVEGLVGTDHERSGLVEKIFAEPEAEEIADGRLDAG